MFKSLGNVLVNPKVGLLFINFEKPDRMRIQGTAFVREDDPLIESFPGAQLIVRMKAQRIFPNCPRYIHKMELASGRCTRRARTTSRPSPSGSAWRSSRTHCQATELLRRKWSELIDDEAIEVQLVRLLLRGFVGGVRPARCFEGSAAGGRTRSCDERRRVRTAQSHIDSVGVKTCDGRKSFAVDTDQDWNRCRCRRRERTQYLDLAHNSGVTVCKLGIQRDSALVMFAGPLLVRRSTCPQPHLQPTVADPLHRRGRAGQNSWVTIGDVRHHRSDTDRRGGGSQCAEQRETLHRRTIAAEQRAVEVVEDPDDVAAIRLGLQHGVAQRGPLADTGIELNVEQHVRAEGLEPTLLAEQGPKPCASASFATPAAMRPAYALPTVNS